MTWNGRNPQATAVAGICIFLVAAVWAVFGQTAGFEFVNYDDPLYVYENANVTNGLNWPGVAWAFTHAECRLYHPLTMVSLQTDYHFHGLDAGGYHLTNLSIHAASAVLLFLVLRQLTGALWRCALVAAIFAVHPLRVESVAWVTERKDTLSAFFFLLTLGAYVRYVRAAASLGRYLLVVLLFALDLLCKPTVVTLPFVLLLLDYWPLHRFAAPASAGGFGVARRLLLEKTPLLVLAAAACVATFFAAGNSVMSAARFPVVLRLSNALVSYVVYLRQMIWPVGLAAFYPYPEKGPPWMEVVAALVVLAIVSGMVLALRRERPWLWVGWLWYLGMLVPMIGFVQAGAWAHADRNTYLSQIGLYVLIVWTAAELSAGWHYRRWIQSGCSAAVLGALILCARTQTAFWRGSESLWSHAVSCTSSNYLALNNLGMALGAEGKLDQAIVEFQKSLEIAPDYAEGYNNLGNALTLKGDDDEAITQYEKALKIQPDSAGTRANLAGILFKHGKLDEAIAQFRKVVELQPENADAQNNLGEALLLKGDIEGARHIFDKTTAMSRDPLSSWQTLGQRFLREHDLDGAIACYRQAIQTNPRSLDAWADLGLAQFQKGDTKAAIDSWQHALDLNPDQLAVQNNLAWLLATAPEKPLRNGPKAVALATRANQASGGNDPVILHTLAAAYAEDGNYGMALVTARRAAALAAAQKSDALAATLQQEMKSYDTNSQQQNSPR